MKIIDNLNKLEKYLVDEADINLDDFQKIIHFLIEIRNEALAINGVGRSTNKNNTKHSVKCLHCGRSFIKKLPHKCNTGYRKRNHKWQELADD